jgi:hypothetical protein
MTSSFANPTPQPLPNKLDYRLKNQVFMRRGKKNQKKSIQNPLNLKF